ncbi:hypothetical protein ABC733_03485 [Mangrovibacter sp. SLW1]
MARMWRKMYCIRGVHPLMVLIKEDGWKPLSVNAGLFISSDKGLFGRIVHLQPMKWDDDGWPRLGKTSSHSATGEPVLCHSKMQALRGEATLVVPQTTDWFPWGKPGLQWQWLANPQNDWTKVSNKGIALFLCS